MIGNQATTQTVPLRLDERGTIRIAGTRVSLDSVIYHFNLGATAEQIAHKFPALDLADVYAVIAYYLANRQTVDDYINQQDAKAEAFKKRLKEDPEYKAWRAGLRERLLAWKYEED
ncbi:MAG: DUF433 domain-containing protein [Acidobacteria bacterium]|nr:DUF433 domain-containing protein [Acidobacteriota bacterium]